MITPADIDAAEYVVYGSGAADLFRVHMRGPSGKGSPGQFDRALFLLGMLLSAMGHGKTHLASIHRVLTKEIPLTKQLDLGIRKVKQGQGGQPDTPWCLTVADLQNLSRRFAEVYAFTEIRCPDVAALGDKSAERARRRAALYELVDTLIDATHVPRPACSADYAIDGSGIWASERYRKNLPTAPVIEGDEDSADPQPSLPTDGIAGGQDLPVASSRRSRIRGRSDAGIGVKTSKDGGRSWYYGYELHALVRVPPESRAKERRAEPLLIERFRLTPASQDVVAPSLEIIDVVLGLGRPFRNLLADRHYSYKKYDRWLVELLKRGIDQVVSLRIDDHGFTEWDGAYIAAGWPHCPGVPPRLGIIAEPDSKAGPAEWTKFATLIEERWAYAADRRSPLTAEGKSRWACPARCGKLGCPRLPATMQVAREHNLPIVAKPPRDEDAPRICTQDSFGLHIRTPEQASLMKITQKYYWGSPQYLSLAHRRTYVEGWFGTLKGDNAADKSRGSNLFTGLAHATLEVACFAVVANIINMRSWHSQTQLGDPQHPLLADHHTHFAGHEYVTNDEYQVLMTYRDQAA